MRRFFCAFLTLATLGVVLFLGACRMAVPPIDSLPVPEHSGLLLPKIFSDNMVLQQGIAVPIWGWADEGENITVRIRGTKVSTKAKDGKWVVRLRRLKPGGPDTLTISGAKTVVFTNVLVGDVWVAGGQSNMEFPLKGAFRSEPDIAAATNSQIRLLKIPKKRSAEPTNNIGATWALCRPETASNFSAVAYYFARDVQKARGVPIGIIECDWGGSSAEAWMRRGVLESDPEYLTNIIETFPAACQRYTNDLAEWEKEKAAAKKEKQEFKKPSPQRPWEPGELYNGMLSPITHYGIKGVIWYQGESNAGRAAQYRRLFPDLIRNWRNDWQEGDFPFLAVQLAPYKTIKHQPDDSDWAELREAQLLATKTLPDVGLVVITDVGDETDVHPKKKEPVGARLALAARGIACHEKIEYSGPVYRGVTFEGDRAVITFDHVGSGLQARDGALKGFAVCGDDHKFLWAPADIEGTNRVVVSSPAIPRPVAVRFGWADYPVVNLWNKEGLPASPFRTDSFPMITEDRR